MEQSAELEQTLTTHNGGTGVRCHGIVNGAQCRQFAVRGRKFCNYHGGKALAGVESPSFRTGLRSMESKRFRSIGKELLEKIDALREDPDLFNLRDDAAYMTALIDRRAEAASEGFGVHVLRNLQQQYATANRAYRSSNIEEFEEAFKNLGETLNAGGDEAKSSDEVIELIGRRVQLVEAEQRVAQSKAYVLEVDQAYSLIMQVVGVVKQCVRNADELTAIKNGINRLLKVYKEESESEDDDVVDAEVVE